MVIKANIIINTGIWHNLLTFSPIEDTEADEFISQFGQSVYPLNHGYAFFTGDHTEWTKIF